MRPGGLTAVCVIGLVLAALGTFGIVGGIFWWLMGEWWTESVTSLNPGLNPQQIESQAQMMDELADVQRRWGVFLVAQSLLHTALVVLLAAACIKGLRMSPGAVPLLTAAMLFGILFELARVYPNLAIQRQSQEISMRHQQRIMQTAGGNPAAMRSAGAMADTVNRITIAFTYAFIAFWTLAKLSYYGGSLWYVRRQATRLRRAAEP